MAENNNFSNYQEKDVDNFHETMIKSNGYIHLDAMLIDIPSFNNNEIQKEAKL